MKISFHLTVLFSFCILLFSCEKKDTPITLPPKGDGTALQVNMGENYDNQFFVSLENQSVVHESRNDSWNLAFECGEDQYHVFLNGGQGMCVYATNKTDFASVNSNDTVNIDNKWRYDVASGNRDSAALSSWNKLQQVFVVKTSKTDKNYKKLKIVSYDQFQYKIEVGNLNDSIPIQRTIVKNASENFVYFNLNINKQLEKIEPSKDSWDIKFCTYNVSFYDQNPVLRYIVVGCLLNPNSTSCYKDSTNSFAYFTKDNSVNFPFNKNLDVVSYDWKKFDFNTNTYTIEAKYTYIIKTQNNRLYKLRFLDFYSPTGVKGSPRFEFEEL